MSATQLLMTLAPLYTLCVDLGDEFSTHTSIKQNPNLLQILLRLRFHSCERKLSSEFKGQCQTVPGVNGPEGSGFSDRGESERCTAAEGDPC